MENKLLFICLDLNFHGSGGSLWFFGSLHGWVLCLRIQAIIMVTAFPILNWGRARAGDSLSRRVREQGSTAGASAGTWAWGTFQERNLHRTQ